MKHWLRDPPLSLSLAMPLVLAGFAALAALLNAYMDWRVEAQRGP